MAVPNFFEADAFSEISLQNFVDKEPWTPGQVGATGIHEPRGFPTREVWIDKINSTVALIPNSKYGAPATQNSQDKGTSRPIGIPHIAIEDTITAESLQGLRVLGTEGQMRGLEAERNIRLRRMSRSLDATEEHQLLGSVKNGGIVFDSDGTTEIVNISTLMDVTPQAEVAMDLGTTTEGALTRKVAAVFRLVHNALGAASALVQRIHVVCSPEFFDDLTSSLDFRESYRRFNDGSQLQEGVAFGRVTWQGIVWEEYRLGTAALGGSFIAADKAHAFPVLAGAYSLNFAPADFIDTVNDIGRPRYIRSWSTDNSGRSITLHLQSNLLPLCSYPEALVPLKRGA